MSALVVMYYNYNAKSENSKSVSLIVLMLTISIAILGFSFFYFTETANAPVESSYPVQVVQGEQHREWIPELPVRLIIPAIDVEADVQYVGLDPEGSGEMAVPSNFTDVGWYKHGVRPGMRGSAVIAGHLNGKEVPEAVFYDLEKLQVGDEVVIMSEERIEDIFQVVRVETYPYNATTTDVFISTDGKKRLNLITCGGEWLPDEKVYDERTVIFTELLTDVE